MDSYISQWMWQCLFIQMCEWKTHFRCLLRCLHTMQHYNNLKVFDFGFLFLVLVYITGFTYYNKICSHLYPNSPLVAREKRMVVFHCYPHCSVTAILVVPTMSVSIQTSFDFIASIILHCVILTALLLLSGIQLFHLICHWYYYLQPLQKLLVFFTNKYNSWLIPIRFNAVILWSRIFFYA